MVMSSFVKRVLDGTMNSRNGQKKGTFFARVDIMFQTGLKHEKLSDTQICNLFVREVDSDTPLD
jgi:hypothetical protein